MLYRHRFQVRAPLANVVAFHARAASMSAITPPPIVAQIHHAPEILQDGDEMAFTLWLGPLPVHWLARIETQSPGSFCDRQLRGPFAEWLHRHSFVELDAHTTLVLDEISFRLRPHPVWGPVGLSMVLGLPFLFAYRAWKSRRLLE